MISRGKRAARSVARPQRSMVPAANSHQYTAPVSKGFEHGANFCSRKVARHAQFPRLTEPKYDACLQHRRATETTGSSPAGGSILTKSAP